VEELPLLSKYEVGHRILDRVRPLLRRKDEGRMTKDGGS
jgi:hypothetical protein